MTMFCHSFMMAGLLLTSTRLRAYAARYASSVCALIWAVVALMAPLHAEPANANNWAIATPAEVGMKSDLVERLGENLRATNPRVRAVAVVRQGKLVAEYYRDDTRPDTPLHVASVTKSVMSLLIGIAIEEKLFAGVDEKAEHFFPELKGEGIDPRLRDLTLRHMLTMTLGFDAEADRYPVYSVDGMAALRRPMAHAPGIAFSYDNWGSHLVSIALARRACVSAEEYAKKRLFGPLGITEYYWGRHPDGNSHGAYQLHLTARDMAKIGELVLRGGDWRGRRIVSAAWIADSTRAQNAGGPPVGSPYGYLWWMARTRSGAPAFFAAGYGGQFIYVVPALDLVIAISTVPDGRRSDTTFVREIIIPSIGSQGPVPPPAGDSPAGR